MDRALGRRQAAKPESAVPSSANEAGPGTLDGAGTGLPMPGLRTIENSSASANDGSISNDGSTNAEEKFEPFAASNASAVKITRRESSDFTEAVLLTKMSEAQLPTARPSTIAEQEYSDKMDAEGPETPTYEMLRVPTPSVFPTVPVVVAVVVTTPAISTGTTTPVGPDIWT